jgi:hypothetical protein
VIDVLLQRFGDVILSSPEAQGWGLAAWLLPGVALVAGAGVVVLVLRRMTAGGGDGAAAAPETMPRPFAASGGGDLDESDLERIVDEELRASGA